MSSNNMSVIFQQKEGESLTYDTPSRNLEFYCHNLLLLLRNKVLLTEFLSQVMGGQSLDVYLV